MPRVSAEATRSSRIDRRAVALARSVAAGLLAASFATPLMVLPPRADAQASPPSEQPAVPAPPATEEPAAPEGAPGSGEMQDDATELPAAEPDEAEQAGEPSAPVPAEQTAPAEAESAAPVAPATTPGAAEAQTEPAAAQTPATPPPAQPAPVAAATRSAPDPSTEGHVAGTEATKEATEEDKSEGPPWNAALVWGQGLSLATFDRGSTLSYNPEYAWSFVAELGYSFDKRTSILADQALNVELTDSESTVQRQQLLLDDTRLTLSRKLVDLSIDDAQSVSLSGSLGLIFPVSKASQAADVYLGTRAAVGVGYTKKDFLKGFGASVGFAYTRRWAGSNTAAADRGFPCVVTGSDASRECFHTGGFATSRDLLALSIDTGLDVTERLAFGAAFGLGWNRKHSLADATIGDDQILTGGRSFGEMSTSHWRNSRLIELSVSYGFTDWLLASAYLSNGFPEIGPDGRRRGLLRATDTVTGLIVRFQIDQLYADLSATGAGRD